MKSNECASRPAWMSSGRIALDRRRFPGAAAIVGIATLAGCSGPPEQPPVQKESAYRSLVLQDRPVGYWRLDEAGAVAFDQTKNDNRGRIATGVTPQTEGVVADDGAMSFDGVSGEILVPASPTLQMPARSVTIEAWLKLAEVQPDTVFVMTKGTSGVQTEYGLALVNGVPAYQSVVELYVADAPPLTAGAWHHVAVAVSGNTKMSFYVDGAEVSSLRARAGHLVTSSTQPVAIGNEAQSSARFLGDIDEAAIYPYALTPEQLAKHASMAKAPAEVRR